MSEEIKKEEVKQEQKQEVAVAEQHVNMVADLSGGLYSSSDTLRIARNFAQDLSKSTMIPMQYQNNYANCLVALEYANRTGQSPLQVMQSLDVIKGTPAWRSKALIGMVNTSGKYDEDLHFSYGKDDKGEIVSCFAWTKKDGVVVEVRYLVNRRYLHKSFLADELERCICRTRRYVVHLLCRNNVCDGVRVLVHHIVFQELTETAVIQAELQHAPAHFVVAHIHAGEYLAEFAHGGGVFRQGEYRRLGKGTQGLWELHHLVHIVADKVLVGAGENLVAAVAGEHHRQRLGRAGYRYLLNQLSLQGGKGLSVRLVQRLPDGKAAAGIAAKLAAHHIHSSVMEKGHLLGVELCHDAAGHSAVLVGWHGGQDKGSGIAAGVGQNIGKFHEITRFPVYLQGYLL